MHRCFLLIVGCSVLLASCTATHLAIPDSAGLSFALLGDQQYDPTRETEFARLLARMDAEPLDFVIHVGDIKGGSTACTDSLLLLRYAEFDASRHPFVLLFGDNEWTDCHRTGGDPLERLDRLRTQFHGGDETLGRRRFTLERQSADPEFAEFRENVRWQRGGVLFVTVHVVGSNNNLGRSPEADAEHFRRTSAALEWLEDSLVHAGEIAARGMLIAMHGNPFESQPEPPNGYTRLVERLQSLVAATTMPVVLVHGDTHICRIDQPLIDPVRGDTLRQFTRVEVYGYPNSHWLRGTILPDDPAVFAFEPVLVPGNPGGECAVQEATEESVH